MSVAVTIDRERVIERLADARRAEQQVAATCRHNPTPEWLAELERCVNAVKAAEEALDLYVAQSLARLSTTSKLPSCS